MAPRRLPEEPGVAVLPLDRLAMLLQRQLGHFPATLFDLHFTLQADRQGRRAAGGGT
ncbi:MAG TPA: hypothetical protein VMV10_14730 [Pirellulales bacterium]|nr:hypothetical protein [Pirellulales bacterium]HVB34218.1 hypothetical protein [Patescibacteria group bacterium]